MAALTWDQVGTRFYETGVDKGVLYIPTNGVYSVGYAWNGLTTVTETPTGGDATPMYADNLKYLNLLSTEELTGTIEAMTYPTAFSACDGSASIGTGITISQQVRAPFGLSYRTRLGNDIDGSDYGYKIHLVYGCLASPSERAYATINDTPEAITFSWAFTTTPVAVTGRKATSLLTINSKDITSTNLTTLENILYGTSGTDPRMPLPDEIVSLLSSTQTTVTTIAPTFVSGTGIITVTGTVGVVYKRADTGAVLSSNNSPTTIALPAIASGSSLRITATPLNSSYVFSAASDEDWVFTRP
jgi:hypothetical protein